MEAGEGCVGPGGRKGHRVRWKHVKLKRSKERNGGREREVGREGEKE